MSYTEFSPPEHLRDWVACYWKRVIEPGETLRVLPDGCADIIMAGSCASAVGTMTGPLVIREMAQTDYFGIRFRPGRAAAFLGCPLSELTDRTVEDRQSCLSAVPDLAHRTDRQSCLSSTLGNVAQRSRPEPCVEAAIERILRTCGRMPIERVAAELSLSRQHLARLFAHHVGISPKLFARVTRFRRALVLGRRNGWAAVAAELDYFDQSHLIAEFREFAGITPGSIFPSGA